jgi:Na+-driven multidrug efflux pump
MVSHLATPMVAVSVLQYLLHAVPVIIVGHPGQLALSVVAIATSITKVICIMKAILVDRSIEYPTNSCR